MLDRCWCWCTMRARVFLINTVKHFGVINEAYSNVALKLIGFLDDLLQCLDHFDGVSSRLVSCLLFGKGADECCFDAIVYDLHDYFVQVAEQGYWSVVVATQAVSFFEKCDDFR